MKFTIWGEIGATGEEGPVVLGGRLRLLLGGLLVHRNAEVSRDDLIAIVWGEESEPANAEASLRQRQYLSRLRRALNEAEDRSGDLITTTPSGYRLDVDRAGVDADVLTDAVAGGTQLRDLDRLAVGEPYGTYSDEWWCFKETGRQRELASQARTQPVAGRSTPSGIVTFLMTDMENSTANWDASQELMAEAVGRHDE
ncbi:MAG: winged helix-turn-helix domain-containing protein [Acidimicrobiia bacterium]|nr:winged helix-turn-helix domain-containing protein [Acidimicrobiia bacterium]